MEKKKAFEEIGARERASHEGLGITESDWEEAVGHGVASLDRFKVPQKEKDELLGAVSTLKPDIVAPPAAGIAHRSQFTFATSSSQSSAAPTRAVFPAPQLSAHLAPSSQG